jgi:hypothetical protein
MVYGPRNEKMGYATLYASLLISFIGMVLVSAFLLHPSATVTRDDTSVFVWSLFSIIFVLGASATMFPHLCSRASSFSTEIDTSRTSLFLGIKIVHGHHPKCPKFRGHEFTFKGKNLCAGCLGLLVGSSISLVISALNLISEIPYPLKVGFLGITLVVIGLLGVPLIKPSLPLIRLVLSAAFVLGFPFILIGIEGNRTITSELVTIGFFIFWMFTRIEISTWGHKRTCHDCGYRCEL